MPASTLPKMAALSVGEASEDLGQVFHEERTALNDANHQSMINSVVFDPEEDLEKVGTELVSGKLFNVV